MYGATTAHNRRYTAVAYGGGGGAKAWCGLLIVWVLLIASVFLHYTVASYV